jgi:hypothetical protein
MRLAAGFAAGFAYTLGRWFGFAWSGLAISATTVALGSFLFPHEPLMAFVLGFAALALLCARRRAEGQAWPEATWGLAKQIFSILTTLAQFTEQAVQELRLQAEIRKVSDLKEIMALGVMTTPAVGADGWPQPPGALLDRPVERR